MTIGERIKEIREKAGISQVDFAYKINVSKQTLYKYENNLITNVPSDKIEAIAKIGRVSPSYIMGWSTNDAETENNLPEEIRAAARGMMDLSPEDQKTAIDMINYLAQKGKEAKDK